MQHTGNAEMLPYNDAKERGMRARSVGRRAAHRGFRVDIREGADQRGDFLSVSRSDRSYEPPTEAVRQQRRSRRRSTGE